MLVVDAINDLMARVGDILEAEAYSDFMLERIHRMKKDIVRPVVRTLKRKPAFAEKAARLETLVSAVEEYVLFFQRDPRNREARRRRVEGIRARIRQDFLGSRDREGEIENLLDDIRRWQWKTSLDESGRLVYSTGGNAAIPARQAIGSQAGAQVIEQAVRAQKPYAHSVRPRDVRGQPGGLISIAKGKRAIIIGDLHGRYDNLENILKDKDNLQSIMSGETHLVFTGDAIHPRSSLMNSPEAYEDSFCVMLLIMTLKAENPFNVHYLIGNHDNAHVGGQATGKGVIRQDQLFEHYIIEKFGESVFEWYREFVRISPAAAKISTGDGSVIAVHAGLTPRVLSRQGLVNIFVKGRTGYELQELLWSRNYARETLLKCLENVRARFIIAGHTNPAQSYAESYGFKIIAEDVFAHVHDLQVIMNAQQDTFGYLDLDMTGPLPERVTDLQTADGRSAFRVLRITQRGEAVSDSKLEEAKDGDTAHENII